MNTSARKQPNMRRRVNVLSELFEGKISLEQDCPQ